MTPEIHGVAKARKVNFGQGTQRVLVIELGDEIQLEIETVNPAGLTATQAMLLASFLTAAASRLEKRKVKPK